ncbi:hypothetical protein Ddye_000075 [Dipteronia dyeriana]|uniref:Uncharacterized protein n=1 Tax=Dipteronia dyeriana TaxID=168575 RepID=A0AAD9XKX7_9ROSI|nr:hypothetical protein Ddye_000075 [Dipteronia dyeriana]
MDNEMSDQSHRFRQKHSIIKIPDTLYRDHSEKAYAPRKFSIGPIHHGKENLTGGESIKVCYMHHFKDRSSKPESFLDDMFQAISQIESEVREQYGVVIKFNQEEFVKIMLVDACFLI